MSVSLGMSVQIFRVDFANIWEYMECHCLHMTLARENWLLDSHPHPPLKILDPVSLTSLLVVKMLTVLVSTISNSQVCLLKKCNSHFSANILAYMPYLMIKGLTIR